MPDGSAGCVFCEIVARRAPAHVVAEDDGTLAFMDINPVNPGHVLVVPRRHATDMCELSADELAAVASAGHRVAVRVRRALEPPGMDLFMANGEAGGQTAFHAHLHVIPRWPSDPWIDPWVPTPGDPGEIAAIAERIRDAGD